MSLRHVFERYIIPGLVVQAVIVGGGYATGRELVEFFVSKGPATGLAGMFVTALLFTAGAMLSFEIARSHCTFDYWSFCRTYLGRFVWLFELGYVASLLLVLSVVSAAMARLLAETLDVPEMISAMVYMIVVALIVFLGSTILERVISAWSVIFYTTYLGLFVMVISRHAREMGAAIDFSRLDAPVALWSGISYTGYNIVVIPILIFVARNFETRREALIAGALAGPLILLPGFALLLALSAFHPQIVDAPLPVTFVLGKLGMPAFSVLIQLVILGALIKTGAGLLHGFNERIARTMADRGAPMPPFVRPAIAAVAMMIAVYAASSFGLIDLIGKGYRFSSYFFLLVWLLPLLTRGLWLVVAPRPAATQPPPDANIGRDDFPGSEHRTYGDAHAKSLGLHRTRPTAAKTGHAFALVPARHGIYREAQHPSHPFVSTIGAPSLCGTSPMIPTIPTQPMQSRSGAPPTVRLRKPYLLFVGDAPSPLHAKTAFGIRDWAPEACLGQMRLPGAHLDLELPEMTPESAAAGGAGSILIGVAPVGGRIPPEWAPILKRALEAGLDIVSGMHTRLAEVPGLEEAARKSGAALIDVRLPRRRFDVGTGRKRSGKRLLTVGTDCALGKKYTALALTKALGTHGVAATFRATGQTGVMIAGEGVAIDAVVADFIAGAAEALSPDAPADHWDVIEGQGSLFHPAYAGVTLGLLHGSQPDALVLCHDPTRAHVGSYPDFPLPDLRVAADRYVEAGRLTNPEIRLAAVSLNTSEMSPADRELIVAQTAKDLGVPCFDPMKSSLDEAVRSVLKS